MRVTYVRVIRNVDDCNVSTLQKTECINRKLEEIVTPTHM